MCTTADIQKELRTLSNKSSNKCCADCKDNNVQFASVTFGVFLCERCAVEHKRINGDTRHLAAQKVEIEGWTPEYVQRVASKGDNMAINGRLEAELPNYYRRPWPGPSCPNFLREAFIQSKYIHEEFSKGAISKGVQCQFACSVKSGVLLKKLRDSDHFVERKFELSVECNYLRYFKPGEDEPKESIDLERLNICFVNHPNFELPPQTALVQFVQNLATRNLFIRSDDKRTIINWYNAIRLGKYHRMCLGVVSMGMKLSAPEIASQLTRDIDMVGWLSKTGPRKSDAWRRRWCMLINRRLLYTDKPFSAFAKGELFIGSHLDGFNTLPNAPDGWKKHNGYAFTIITPNRSFVFLTDSEEEQQKWISILNKVISLPMTLGDSKQAASVASKHYSFI